jgi:CRP-like cAMP-binding protein
LQRQLAELMTKPVKERLALLLLKLATEYGEDRISGTRSLGLAVTHEGLAQLVGASREMVSKVMRQFRDARLGPRFAQDHRNGESGRHE